MNLETYISEFSKYVIAVILALYAIECIWIFFKNNEEKSGGNYIRQNILMFAFHFSSFMVICFETNSVSSLIFYAFQQIVLYAVIMLYKAFYPRSNRLLVNNMCMLLSISFVVLTRLEYGKALRQFIIATFSLIIALLIPFFIHHLKLIRNLKWVYAIAGVVLLGIVMILGQTTYGSKISYSIAGISFQPAEFVKIIFVFFVSSALYKAESFLEILTSSMIAALHVAIQVVNKDLGSALIFFVVYIFMLFIATKKIYYLGLGLVAGGGASYVAYRLFDHIKVRVQAWSDPWSVIDSAGYQITQSLFAITSGGWFGLGLFKGNPNSIPFVEDDFVFSAITEELGVIFAISLLLICLSCFLEFMRISTHLNDRFYQLIAFGLGITYIFQVFLTVGGGSKFIPLTGVTLPLVSYGGTSVLTTLIMFAILEGLCMISKDEAIALEGRKGNVHFTKRVEEAGYQKKHMPARRNSSESRRKSADSNRAEVYPGGSFEYSQPKQRIGYGRPRAMQEEYDEYMDEYDEEYYDEYVDDYESTDEDYSEEYDNEYDEEYAGEYDSYDEEYDEEYDEYDDEYNKEYDEYEEEYSEEYDDDYEDTKKPKLTPIDPATVNELMEEYEEDIRIERLGKIYYNEEEYEKDLKSKKR